MTKLEQSDQHPNLYEYRGFLINYMEDLSGRHIMWFKENIVREDGEPEPIGEKVRGSSKEEAEALIINKIDHLKSNK